MGSDISKVLATCGHCYCDTTSTELTDDKFRITGNHHFCSIDSNHKCNSSNHDDSPYVYAQSSFYLRFNSHDGSKQIIDSDDDSYDSKLDLYVFNDESPNNSDLLFRSANNSFNSSDIGTNVSTLSFKSAVNPFIEEIVLINTIAQEHDNTTLPNKNESKNLPQPSLENDNTNTNKQSSDTTTRNNKIISRRSLIIKKVLLVLIIFILNLLKKNILVNHHEMK